MLTVKFYEDVKDELLRFAVVIAKHDGKWVLCKHKERETLEFPGGHRETGEAIAETAKRELMEETGAVKFYPAKSLFYESLSLPLSVSADHSYSTIHQPAPASALPDH